MRTRWHVPNEFLDALIGLYFVGTLFGFLGSIPANGGLGFDRAHFASTLLLCLFSAPFVLGGAAAFGLRLVPHLWKNRPRRVTEPVTKDFREGWRP
jgi:hypothetical protein